MEYLKLATRPGRTLLFTGLPSSGKSTLATALANTIPDPVQVLDGDILRSQFFPELGFSKADRMENVQRAGRLATMFAAHGITVLVALIAPYRSARDWVRQIHADAALNYAEVWVDAPLAVCADRDVKGLYAKARRGELRRLTGVDDPYEEPVRAELHLRTDRTSVSDCLCQLVALLDTMPNNMAAMGSIHE